MPEIKKKKDLDLLKESIMSKTKPLEEIEVKEREKKYFGEEQEEERFEEKKPPAQKKGEMVFRQSSSKEKTAEEEKGLYESKEFQEFVVSRQTRMEEKKGEVEKFSEKKEKPKKSESGSGFGESKGIEGKRIEEIEKIAKEKYGIGEVKEGEIEEDKEKKEIEIEEMEKKEEPRRIITEPAPKFEYSEKDIKFEQIHQPYASKQEVLKKLRESSMQFLHERSEAKVKELNSVIPKKGDLSYEETREEKGGALAALKSLAEQFGSLGSFIARGLMKDAGISPIDKVFFEGLTKEEAKQFKRLVHNLSPMTQKFTKEEIFAGILLEGYSKKIATRVIGALYNI